MGSKHIADFRAKFLERGLTPLEPIIDAKHKVDCIDADGYKYRLCYKGSVSDKRTKQFDKCDKTNPFKAYNMCLYASRVQEGVVILSTDDELFDASKTKIKFICPICGDSFYKKWCHWIAMPLNRHCCPKCNDNPIASGNSQYVELTEQWLMSHSIDFEREFKFDDCRNKRALRFDFYVRKEESIILIEVDGMQHFYTSTWTNEEKLKYNQMCDKIKDDYCKNNGYTLVRIPYWLYRTDTYKQILHDTIIG